MDDEMTSLKEEIESRIRTALFHANEKRGTEVEEICTNEILKLFEQKIDEYIKHYSKQQSFVSISECNNWDDKIIHSFGQGKIFGLKMLKCEIMELKQELKEEGE